MKSQIDELEEGHARGIRGLRELPLEVAVSMEEPLGSLIRAVQRTATMVEREGGVDGFQGDKDSSS